MRGQQNARILAGRPAVDFIGRTAEAERLLAHARTADDGLLILSVPGAGASELLKQTFDRLFREQQDIIPFYFAIRPGLRSVSEVAASFLDEFVRQLVAFRRQDPTIFLSPGSLDEVAEVALNIGGFWIDKLIDTARMAGTITEGGRTFVRGCVSAPVRAATNDARSVVMIDDVHELLNIDGGDLFLDEVNHLFGNAGIPFILAGHRRFLHGRIDSRRMELDNLSLDAARTVAEIFARDTGISISEPSRDLIAVQFGHNPALMRQLVRTASDDGVALDSFDGVEKVYADSLFGGRISRDFDARVTAACRGSEIERRVVSMLFDGQVSETGRVERDRWYRRLQLGETETDALLNRLNISELIRLTPLYIESMSENIALTDYIAARFRLTAATESRAGVFSESLAAYIKRAPELMARSYRVNSSFNVREVLGSFTGQTVASALVDYGEFRKDLKGAPEDEVLDLLRSGPSIKLPRIFFTTAASAFYKPIAQLAESERSAIALGFESSNGEAEVTWIAAEIDSKLEANRATAEFWCDRLEAAALMCDFKQFKIWLIATEGFAPDALKVLRSRNAYGSSRRQVELLRRFLNVPSLTSSQPLGDNEYEMVIPMADDSELIAAHAVEEIAKRHHLDPKSINQLKTALVEACINAAEHSLSPDGKIYQRFRVEDDRVVLTVSNRGLRLASRLPAEEPNDGRRGWGLKLMRRLMDEVTIERVDDGTRIVMTKLLNADRGMRNP